MVVAIAVRDDLQRAALKARLRVIFAPDPERHAMERSFRAFVREAWFFVEPVTALVPGFYIDALCEHLQAVAEGTIRNLLITIPPGFAKSTLVSVLYPAWRWIDHPEHRFLTTSHDGDLAIRDAVRSRRVIQSRWYQERWGNRFRMTGDQNVKSRYENDHTGYRIAAGVNAGLTGERADTMSCDDPHSVKHVTSETIREATVRWWTETMGTRLNDPNTGSRIVIQQRVHEADLAGSLIDAGTYEHLNLPMEYESSQHVTGIGWQDPRTEPGELLHPARYDATWVAEKKVEFGSAMWAGQFQQRPSPAEGAILKRDWWRHWREPLPAFEWLLQSWDTAFKTGQENDYSVGLTVGLGDGEIYLLDLWRDKVEFPALRRYVRDGFVKWRPDEIVVEDKASGQSLIQEMGPGGTLGGNGGEPLPIVPFSTDRDKIARVHAVSPYVERGAVFVPAQAPWVDAFLHECAAFPAGQHDDQVDAFTQAVLRIVSRGRESLRPADPGLLSGYFAGMPT